MGFEPTASFVRGLHQLIHSNCYTLSCCIESIKTNPATGLNQCGLPVAYRAKLHKHAPRDLNPDPPGWNRSCCRYTRGVCFNRNTMTSTQAAVAGIEPASRRLTVAHPYQHEYHRIIIFLLHLPAVRGVRVAGFEPAISCFQGTRVRPDFPTPCYKKHPAGIEPALPPWQDSRLPLHHGRESVSVDLNLQEHQVGFEPT